MSMYIYKMPYSKRLALMRILDVNFQWKQLGAAIGYNAEEIATFGLAIHRYGGSPTDDLLQKWGHSNPTVDELFLHLMNMKQYRGCREIQAIVSDSYVRELDRREGKLRDGKFGDPRPMNNRLDSMDDQSSICSDMSALPKPPGRGGSTTSHRMHISPRETPLPPYSSTNGSMFCGATNITNNHSTKYNYPPDDKRSNHTNSTAAPSKPDPSLHSWQSSRREPVESAYDPTGEVPNQSAHLSPDRPASNFPQKSSDPLKLKQANVEKETLQAALAYTQRYSLAELQDATNYFADNRVLGRGGFGVVYRGNIRRLNLDVAIKKINKCDNHQEIEALFVYRHDNIIPLLGYCREKEHMSLVYPYMANGALDSRLICEKDGPALTWIQRMDILLGTAKAVHYLHSVQDKPLIHGDIKSANILIDTHYQAKVADFGLAKHATGGSTTSRYTHVSQYHPNIYGSRPYLPQEYLADTSQLHITIDTYSFGVVIFETCIGVKAIDAKSIPHNDSYPMLKDLMDSYRDVDDKSVLIKLRDPKCPEWTDNQWRGTLDLGFKCTKQAKKKRPLMNEVMDRLTELHGIAQTVLNTQEREKSSTSFGPRYPQSLSGSEKSVNMSYDSQGQGASLRAGNFPSTNKVSAVTNQMSGLKVTKGHMLEPILSMSTKEHELQNNNNISKKDPDYLHPPGVKQPNRNVAGTTDDDYIHPRQSDTPDYENTPARTRESNHQGKVAKGDYMHPPGSGRCDLEHNQQDKTNPELQKFAQKDPDDLPYDERKLQDPDMSDCLEQSSNTSQQSVPSRWVHESDMDPDDPKWLKCDTEKLAAMQQPSSELSNQPTSPTDCYPNQFKNSEAWLLQDFYDAQKTRMPDEGTSEGYTDDITEPSMDPSAELSEQLSDSELQLSDSSRGSLEQAPTVPNQYVTMPPPSKPIKATTPNAKVAHCAPPASHASDIHGSSWYESLDESKPPQNHGNPLAAHHYQNHAVSAPARAQPISIQATNQAVRPLFTATNSSNEEGISVRGKPSTLSNTSSQQACMPKHISHQGAGQLYLPQVPLDEINVAPEVSGAVGPESDSPPKTVYSEYVEDSMEHIEKIRNKKKIAWMDDFGKK